ncbi:hypothetical protein GS597_00030 [Synechococcales cyanobacterium C]|uniref:Uncharacterized protein n=1 Tax=Petrachloros mirabilis ULC683 TaxID=2781853 RepID=A0A8K1ZVK4_9CYAN|nr:hypothetical protein [Petrachloros mirabilis]NCJ04933.1 hypothetical protein [Petrachloros mirabilis ULC683]
MLHHISFAVNDPLHAAEVVAELWQGRAIPFPHHLGSYIALSLDQYGTAIEFMPKGTVLKPGASTEEPVQFSEFNLGMAGYTATHVNIAVPISETKIYEIANREGWRAVRCQRAEFFKLIEFWLENEILLELLPPNLIKQYLTTMQPENLKVILDAGD